MTEHISARVDEEIAKLLDEPGLNKSETIEVALEQYFNANGHKQTVVDFRLSQVQDDIQTLESQLESKRETEKHLKSLQAEFEQHEQEQQEEQLKQVIQQVDVIDLSSMDEPVVDATDDQLKEYATELGMSVEELREKIIAESDF